MSRQQKLLACWFLSTLAVTCHGVCFTSEHTAVTPKHGIKFETDDFDLNQMVKSLFSLMRLLGRETLSPLGNGFYKAPEQEKTCIWLSHKIPFSHIIDSSLNFTLDSIPLVTDIQQLDSDLFLIHHKGRAEFMNGVQFRRMAGKLGLKLNLLWDQTIPESSFMTVQRGAGGVLTLESYNPQRPSACILNAQGLTLQFMVENVYQRLHSLWNDLQRVLRFYKHNMPVCLGLSEISMKNLAGLSSSALSDCLEGGAQ